jgi:hypothetical protein
MWDRIAKFDVVKIDAGWTIIWKGSRRWWRS